MCAVELPAALRSSDARLHAAVATLLEQLPIRSVTVNNTRTEAIVHLHRDRGLSDDLCETAERLLAEAAAVPDADLSDDSTDEPYSAVISWCDPRNLSLCFAKAPAPATGWRRTTLLLASGVFLALGLLGIILPGLPTTPFVLLASYCLLRSSPVFHRRLLDSRLFGGVLRDWYQCRGLRRDVRYKAIAVVLLVVAASLLLASLSNTVRLAIVAIAACGIAYVWRLPNVVETVPPNVKTPPSLRD